MELIWEDDTNYEMQRNIVIMKVKMRYIELGLVIPTEADYETSSQINDALNALPPSDQREAKRKFRKQARKALGKKNYCDRNAKRKRSAVYSMFWREAWKSLDKKGDPDLMGNLADFV